jgi:Chalcone isomerase-like
MFSGRIFALLVSLVLSLSAFPAAAAQPTSTSFEPTQTVGGVQLKLNGAGARYKAIFKIYELGLYTSKKVSTPEELLNVTGPVKLSFVAMRDLPSTDLGISFIRGLANNASNDLIQRHTLSSNRLIEIFSAKNKLQTGDTFSMEYVPGKGTYFYIQGQQQGNAVGDAEFFRMILKIWTGSVPVDYKLKEALISM